MHDLRERGNPDSVTTAELSYVWVQVPIEGQLVWTTVPVGGGKVDTRTISDRVDDLNRQMEALREEFRRLSEQMQYGGVA